MGEGEPRCRDEAERETRLVLDQLTRPQAGQLREISRRVMHAIDPGDPGPRAAVTRRAAPPRPVTLPRPVTETLP